MNSAGNAFRFSFLSYVFFFAMVPIIGCGF